MKNSTNDKRTQLFSTTLFAAALAAVTLISGNVHAAPSLKADKVDLSFTLEGAVVSTAVLGSTSEISVGAIYNRGGSMTVSNVKSTTKIKGAVVSTAVLGSTSKVAVGSIMSTN